MNPNGRTQSFDEDVRRRLRAVVESPGIIRAKQDAELLRRVEQYKARKIRVNWWVLLGAFILICAALASVIGFLWALEWIDVWLGGMHVA